MTGDNGQTFTDVTTPASVGEGDENIVGTSIERTYVDETFAVDSGAAGLSDLPLLTAADVTPGEDAAWVALATSDATRDSDGTLDSVTISGVPSGWSLSGDGAASITVGTWTAASGEFGGLALVAPFADGSETFSVTASETETGPTGAVVATATTSLVVDAAVEAPSFTLTTSGSGGAGEPIAPSGIGGTGDSRDTSASASLPGSGTASGGSGGASGPVTPTAAITTATIDPTVVINGTPVEGTTLTASAIVTRGFTGTTEFYWQRFYAGSWWDIPIELSPYTAGEIFTFETSPTYVVREEDENVSAIRVEVDLVDPTGITVATADSPSIGPVLDEPATLALSPITGSPVEGATLTVSAQVVTDEGTFTPLLNWQRFYSGGWWDIPVELSPYSSGEALTFVTTPTYVVRAEDTNVLAIRVEGTYVDDTGQTFTITDGAETISEPPQLTAADVTLGENVASVALTITVAAQDTDYTLGGVTISGVPSGWSLSGDGAASIAGGTWTVGSGGLGGLTLVAPSTEAETFTLSVTASETALGPNGTQTATATTSFAVTVTEATPSITAAISGTAQEGQTLTAVVSGAEEDDTLSFTWVSGETTLGTASTYTVAETDEGNAITLTVTDVADFGGGTASASAPSASVSDAAPSIGTPLISGTAQEGQTLTASATAGQSDNPVSYAWYSSADNYANPIGSGASYLVKEADEGSTIEVKATATNAQGLTASQTSAPSASVSDAAPTVSVPLISGTAQEGQTLSASATAGQSDNPVSYAWYSSADNYTNPIGSGASYLVKEADEGSTIEVKATATNAQGLTASQTSAPSASVSDAAPSIGTPLISGTAQEGQTLSASATAGQSDNPVSYAWYSSADNYTNPIGSGASYLVEEADEGNTIEVKATATNAQGLTASQTSAPSASVTDAAPSIGTPLISGTAQEGQTLSASATAGQSDNPVSYAWYSSADGYANAIGSGASYLVKEADEGSTIEVKATATNAQGLTASQTSAPSASVSDAAPSIGTPLISGTAQEGQTLTASATAGQSDNPVSYAWYSSADNYANPIGSGASYLVKEGDEGSTIEVKATATNAQGLTASQTSAPSASVSDAAPTVSVPLISGTAQEGQTLTASATAGQSDNPVSYAWYSSADNYTNPIGSGASYLVKEADEGSTIEVKATATNAQGLTASQTSAPSASVSDAAPTVSVPVISGTAQEGQTLTASATAGQSDNPVSYAWYSSADNYTNPIGSGASYLVKEADEGSTIEVKATATNAQGLTASQTSAPDGPVSDAAPTVSVPVISGTAQEGQTLSASATAGQSDNPVSYAWYSSADNYTNPIGSGASYLVKEADEGSTIEVKATATNAQGLTASQTSAPSASVSDAAPSIGTPLISGTAQEGQTLSASATAGQSDNPVSYAWYSSADNYTNPIGSGASYLVKEADEGDTIEVEATATNAQGLTASQTSAPSASVSDAAPTVSVPLISGTAQEGQTLTASATAGQSDNPVSYAWYSSVDGYANSIGSGASYLVKEGDEGSTIEVKATTTNAQGLTASQTSAADGPVTDAAPTVSVPVISGTAQEGQTLSASATAGQSDNPVSYAWYSSVDNYANPIGSGASYLVKEADEGSTIEVKATATNAQGLTASQTSAADGPVTDAAPTVSVPVISGTAQEGQTLTASATAGQSDNPVSYAWYSSVDGYANPIGSGASYLVKEGDEGSTIEVKATATNAQGLTASQTSAADGPVTDAAPTVSVPVISGTAQEGQTLSASATAGQSDNPVSYAWYSSVDGYANPIGSGASYLVKEGDEGSTIEVKATTTNAQGLTASQTSAPSASVSDAAPTVSVPLISGTAQEGQTLSASATAGQSDNPVSYAWYSSVDGYANSIGSGASYLVKEGDEGSTIEVKATTTNAQGLTASQTSAPSASVTDAAPTVSVPVISGTAQEGQTLSASATAGQSDNPVSYAWYSSADNYANPIGSGASYLVKEADEGSTIEVKATATNAQGLTASQTSAADGPVTDAAPTVSVPLISGTAQEGQTLSASATAGQSDNPVSYAWYSSADGYANAIGSGASYLVKEADEGSTIEVKATATNAQGLTASQTSAPSASVTDAAPSIGTPLISGTAQEGQTLSASATAGQSDNPVSYAWYSSADNYANPIGSGASYLVKEGDEGSTIEVKATATNAQGLTASQTSAPSASVSDAAPTVSVPLISGTAQEGQTLTASATAGQSDNPVSYAWYSSADNYTNPIGSGASYLVKEADEGSTIEVKATATNAQGLTASQTSAADGPVTDAAPTVSVPVISGTAQEGQTLTASATAGQSDNPVSYAWYSSADGYANSIGSGASYLVKEADEGSTIEVKATATNAQGLTASQTSAPSASVSDAAPTVSVPLISGTAQEGQTLSASATAGQSDNPVSYAWYSSADNYTNPIGGGASYLVKEGDEGSTIEVKATATNAQGLTASQTSAADGPVTDAAPTVSVPVISGTAQEGQTLSASATAGQSDNPVSYAWYSSVDGYANPIGSGASYLVKEGDEGSTIEVKATTTNAQGLTASQTSAPSASVTDAAPTVSVPVISGTAQEGQTLTASATAGQSDNPVSYAWYSSADNYTNPIGSGASYLVEEADEGNTIEVKATATNAQGLTASQTSAPSASVTDAAPSIGTPLISGTAQEGQTLSASATAGQSDNPVSYAWYSSADNYANPIGSGASYLVKEADEGDTIEVKATATNAQGLTASQTSAADGPVTDAAPTVSVPVISGTAQEGQTLTASATAGQSDNPVSYAWYSSADGYANSIGSGASYLVKEADEGSTIEVKATATNAQGLTASQTSAPSASVSDAAPTVSVPLISGTAQEGQTLSASATAGQSDNPVSYAWYSSADNYTNPIGGGASYLVKEGDEGSTIEVKATATNAQGLTASQTSAADGPVTDAAPTVSVPVISGTAQEGQTLSASATAGQSDNPVSYAWYSSVDGYANPIGSGASYLVKEGDEGSTIEVKATTTNAQGLTASQTSAPSASVTDAAPTVSVPVISGTAQEGQTLTASATAGQSDNPVSYAWYSSADNYTNPIGSGASYLVEEADEGNTIEVKATATNAQGLTASQTSAPSASVTDAAPSIGTPLISGTAQEGQTLSASATAGQSDNPVSYAWYSSADNYANPIGSGASYLVKEADEGDTIEVKATATNAQGQTASQTSAPSASVTDKPPGFGTTTSFSASEEGPITLSGLSVTGDSDDTLSATISGVPSGWTVDDPDRTIIVGTSGGASGVVNVADLGSLVVTAPDNGGETATLTLTVSNPEVGGTSVSEILTVTASAVAEPATFGTTTSWSGGESVTLSGLSATGDPDDTLNATFTGLSSGWTLVDTHSTSSFTGTSSITAIPVSDLGSLVVVAPRTTDSATDLLTLTISSSEGGTTASRSETLVVTATATAEPPIFNGPTTFYGGTSVTLSSLGASAVGGDTLGPDATITGLSLNWTLVDTHSTSSFTGTSITAIPVSDLGALVVVPPSGTSYSVTDVLTLTIPSNLGASTTSGSEALSLVAQKYTGLSGNQTGDNLTNADLIGADLRMVNFTGATLTGATLTNADLTGATLTNANLSGADLSGATLHNATGGGADLSGADLAGADLHNTDLTSATLTGADLMGATVHNANLTDATLTGADLRGADFNSATLTGATFPLQLSLLGASAGGHDVTGDVTDGFTGAVTMTAVDNGTTLGSVAISYSSTAAPEAWSIGNVTFAQGDSITVTARDSEGAFYSASGTVVAAAPAGVAGSPINLALSDPAGGAPIAVAIAGIPEGWSLNAGSDLGNGTWTVETSDPSALAISPSGGFVGAVVLPVTESWIKADGSGASQYVSDNVEAYAPGNPIFALSSADTLTGSVANDLFVFARPIGNDRIYDFKTASNRIDLIGFSGISSFADLQSKMANDANGDAVLTLGSGETITIVGVDAASLGAANFMFDDEPTTSNAGTMAIGDGATLPLGGAVDNSGTIALDSAGDKTELVVLSGGVTLQGGGEVTLSDNTGNAIVGSGADTTLTNLDNFISGAGRLGDDSMTLSNAGVIDATGVNPLIIDTGGNGISNSGTIEATGAGGLVIGGAVANSGRLSADGGNLTVDGAVTGAGIATIAGTGTFEFGAASAEDTSFASGAAGTLRLDQSAAFSGTVSGFAGGDAIDLADLAFGSNTALSYTDNGAGGGVVTIGNGMQVVDLALLGQYAAAGFHAHSDPGGGTLITYTLQTSSSDATSLTNLGHQP